MELNLGRNNPVPKDSQKEDGRRLRTSAGGCLAVVQINWGYRAHTVVWRLIVSVKCGISLGIVLLQGSSLFYLH